MEKFSGSNASITHLFGRSIHVGGVSAAIHHGLTTNMPVHLHVFTRDYNTAHLFAGVADEADILTNIRVKYRDEKWLDDGLDEYECNGEPIWASSPARATAEAIAEEELFDYDAKLDLVRSYIGQGYSIPELKLYADMMCVAGALKQILSEI